MSEAMTFPDGVEEFMEQYKVVDTEQVYTNGTEFVPIFRMRQWFQHEPRQRWIPCSEKLPKDIKPVIVTWKNTDPKSYYQYIVGKHYIGTAHYKGGKWFWYSSVTEDLLAEYGRCDSEEFDEAIEVVAWMPLPKPYEGRTDEQIH